jgi:hypothetical protein
MEERTSKGFENWRVSPTAKCGPQSSESTGSAKLMINIDQRRNFIAELIFVPRFNPFSKLKSTILMYFSEHELLRGCQLKGIYEA